MQDLVKQEFSQLVKGELDDTVDAALQRSEEADEHLQSALVELLPSPGLYEAADRALKLMQKNVRNALGPKAWIRPFGVFAEGLAMPGSVLEVCLEFRNRNGPVDKTPDMVRGATSLDKATKKLNAAFSVLEVDLGSASGGEDYPHAQLQYKDKESEVVIDMVLYAGAVDASSGLERGLMDRLAHRLLLESSRGQGLVRLVHWWALVLGLMELPGALPFESWTMLCLYFLVSQGDFAAKKVEEKALESQQASYDLPEPLLGVGVVSADVVGFFKMVVRLGQASPAVRGTGGGTSSGISLAHGSDIHVQGDAVFFVEDPMANILEGQSLNIAAGLSHEAWRRAFLECKELASLLGDRNGVPLPGRIDSWLASMKQSSSELAFGDGTQANTAKADVGLLPSTPPNAPPAASADERLHLPKTPLANDGGPLQHIPRTPPMAPPSAQATERAPFVWKGKTELTEKQAPFVWKGGKTELTADHGGDEQGVAKPQSGNKRPLPGGASAERRVAPRGWEAPSAAKPAGVTKQEKPAAKARPKIVRPGRF
eukprot:TRINITY_DN122054_c0_g1_i1.p1 TRINITY_DN122054_c0_g1~~TRINITY_DN122054_c0_g1_i1.p1  ORF type:complete len:542 (+),score=152.31 TRINITY_DN122054_c0_g1_i1:137-1762(+)